MTTLKTPTHALALAVELSLRSVHCYDEQQFAELRDAIRDLPFNVNKSAPFIARVVADVVAITPQEMPPKSDVVAVLLDTVAYRFGLQSRGAAWKTIGVKPSQGRRFLQMPGTPMDWRTFHTLCHAALNRAYRADGHVSYGTFGMHSFSGLDHSGAFFQEVAGITAFP